MSPIHISPVQADEINVLSALSYRTFHEAFADQNNPEDFKAFISKAFTVEKLTREYEDPETEFYFTHVDDQLAGYLKLNFGDAQTEHELDNALEIERIYIDAPFQGKRIGEFMLNFSVEKARQKELDWIWLGVWEKNIRAFRFYEKHGFIKFGSHTFMVGNDPQTDLLMRRSLND